MLSCTTVRPPLLALSLSLSLFLPFSFSRAPAPSLSLSLSLSLSRPVSLDFSWIRAFLALSPLGLSPLCLPACLFFLRSEPLAIFSRTFLRLVHRIPKHLAMRHRFSFSLRPSPSLTLSISLLFSLSLPLSISLSLPPSRYLSVFILLCLYVSLSLSVCLSVCLSLSLPLSLSLSLSVSLSLSISSSFSTSSSFSRFSQSIYLSVARSSCLFLSFYQCRFLSLFLSLTLSLSLSLCTSLPPSLPVSLFVCYSLFGVEPQFGVNRLVDFRTVSARYRRGVSREFESTCGPNVSDHLAGTPHSGCSLAVQLPDLRFH